MTTNNNNPQQQQQQQKQQKENMNTTTNTTILIKNFRQAASLPHIYRCGSTDRLAELFLTSSSSPSAPSHHHHIITLPAAAAAAAAHDIPLRRAHLIIDLRTPSERKDEMAALWMTRANGGPFMVKTIDFPQNNIATKTITTTTPLHSSPSQQQQKRMVVRIDLLSRSRLLSYAERRQSSSSLSRHHDDDVTTMKNNGDNNNHHHRHHHRRRRHNVLRTLLNQKGLIGLYEILWEESRQEIFEVLKELTLFFEQRRPRRTAADNNDNDDGGGGDVMIHCVQGKDRTGLIIMLCQSMMGVSDEIIIHDYHLSEDDGSMASQLSSSRSSSRSQRRQLSWEKAAPRHVMEEMLSLLRERYGSIDGYLDTVGFDHCWRERFRTALEKAEEVNSGCGNSSVADVVGDTTLQSRL